MPALSNLLPRDPHTDHHHHLLQIRNPHHHDDMRHQGPKGLSPAAIGLLVPIFVVFVFGPFLCILLVRKRRRNRRAPRRLDVVAPAVKRADARKTLEGVTSVSTIADADRNAGDEKRECMGVAEKEVVDDTSSVMDRDCAICLSTLHAPSPPEPAKISSESSNITLSRPASVANLSVAETEKEDILRLKACNHEFHAECLISWFIIKKYSCPICRAVYYEKEGESRDTPEMEQGDESGQLESQAAESNAARR